MISLTLRKRMAYANFTNYTTKLKLQIKTDESYLLKPGHFPTHTLFTLTRFLTKVFNSVRRHLQQRKNFPCFDLSSTHKTGLFQLLLFHVPSSFTFFTVPFYLLTPFMKCPLNPPISLPLPFVSFVNTEKTRRLSQTEPG